MRTLNIDGVDKVGKHTAVISTAEKLKSNGYNVLITDFPQYWFFGSVIRKALRNKNLKIVEKNKELELRCALFAMDRLLSFIIAKDFYKDNNIIVSDRGWTSNAVTIGYGVAAGLIKHEYVKDLVTKLEYFDKEFIEYFKPEVVFLDLGKNGISAHDLEGKEREDIHEQPEPQKEAMNIYDNYLNLSRVNTQINGKWRDRNEIADDILNKVGDVKNLNKEGSVKILGPEIFIEKVFSYDIKLALLDLLEIWNKSFYTGDKEVLNKTEAEISEYLLLHIPDRINFAVPVEVKNGLIRLINEYPDLNYLIKDFGGKSYLNL